MDKKIVKVTGYEELDKRTHLPGAIIKSKCPHCGKEQERDLGTGPYLSYPVTNKPSTIYFSCGEEVGIDHPHVEWSINAIVRMSLEVNPQIREPWSSDDEIKTKLKESYKNENG